MADMWRPTSSPAPPPRLERGLKRVVRVGATEGAAASEGADTGVAKGAPRHYQYRQQNASSSRYNKAPNHKKKACTNEVRLYNAVYNTAHEKTRETL